MKTPNDSQWRKLCEMAGWKRVGEHWYFGDTDSARIECSFLSSDTDALMRLMGKLFYGEEPTRSGHELRLTAFAVHGKGHRRSGIECAAFVVNEDPAERYRLAACDILTQLAEAEGWE